MNDYVARIHLKIPDKNNENARKKLIDYCLSSKEQCLAIGWQGAHKNGIKETYNDFYESSRGERTNPVLNLFKEAEENDLFWTRDLDGVYWICRVTDKAQAKFVEELGIGAVIPVKAYRYGLEVPGQIKASFNRPRGGTAEKIKDQDKVIFEYSKYIYNQLSGEAYYTIEKLKGKLLDNLPDFDLEELVISYLQLKENFYVLSNSIANKSTTIEIECELIRRDKKPAEKAVVQVKGGNREIDADKYKQFSEGGYKVYLYAKTIKNTEKVNYIRITREQLEEFYAEYKDLLPESITKWEELIR